ncbi:unnamed protein product [Cuscuta epithymum]|uniref:Uncharacterized protein n=1 Tax=Cuscuta epithymum TaxID=186058 RepID=A0AAV0E4F4_9ASTE|nr:unnamed protein product [Cuscuta epithymum]
MFSLLSLCWIIVIISLVVLVPTYCRRARYILGEDFRSPEILSEDSVYASRAMVVFAVFLCRCLSKVAALLGWSRRGVSAASSVNNGDQTRCPKSRDEDNTQSVRTGRTVRSKQSGQIPNKWNVY